MQNKKHLTKIVNYILYCIVIILSIFVLASNTPIFGFRVFVVGSGSMKPKIASGALIIDRAQKNYRVDDIITFVDISSPNKTITHRLVGFVLRDDQKYLVTRGDANKENDFQLLKPSKVIGKVILNIPYAGFIANFAKTIPGLICLIIIPATIIIYEEVINTTKDVRKWRKKKLKKVGLR
jgi:signal peptidase I